MKRAGGQGQKRAATQQKRNVFYALPASEIYTVHIWELARIFIF